MVDCAIVVIPEERTEGSDAPKVERITYAEFKTGLTFTEVRRMLWSNSDTATEWRQKRRGSVLGYWRSLKLDMWNQFCAQNPERVAE